MTSEHEHEWVETTAPGADYRCRICGEWNENADPELTVPPDGMVEAAAEGMHSLYNESAVDWADETDKSFYRGAARAALIAASKWERQDEGLI